jgi:two-component system cell cycle sensor histidine kinase/response regulator CckA
METKPAHLSREPFPPAADAIAAPIDADAANALAAESFSQRVAGVAHDFNNLLTAMLGWCDVLLEDHAPEHASYAGLVQIRANTVRATRLVRHLANDARAARPAAGRLGVGEALADLSPTLQQLLGAGTDLRIEQLGALGSVALDAVQFDRILMNLVVNAREALLARHRVVTIRTLVDEFDDDRPPPVPSMRPGRYVRIDVIDTGIGIPERLASRIFEPQVSTKNRGSGLGLAIVQGIVRQAGGVISAKGQPGAGSTFSVYLPTDDPVAAALPPMHERKARSEAEAGRSGRHGAD